MDRVSDAAGIPKVNCLLATSVLLALEAPNGAVGAVPDAAGSPNVKIGLFSAGAGGVLGAAPNENGVLGLPSALLCARPNEKGLFAGAVPEGCGVVDDVVVTMGGTTGVKAEPSFGVIAAAGSSSVDPSAVLRSAGAAIEASNAILFSDSLGISTFGGPNENTGGVASDVSAALGSVVKEKACGFDGLAGFSNNEADPAGSSVLLACDVAVPNDADTVSPPNADLSLVTFAAPRL